MRPSERSAEETRDRLAEQYAMSSQTQSQSHAYPQRAGSTPMHSESVSQPVYSLRVGLGGGAEINSGSSLTPSRIYSDSDLSAILAQYELGGSDGERFAESISARSRSTLTHGGSPAWTSSAADKASGISRGQSASQTVSQSIIPPLQLLHSYNCSQAAHDRIFPELTHGLSGHITAAATPSAANSYGMNRSQAGSKTDMNRIVSSSSSSSSSSSAVRIPSSLVPAHSYSSSVADSALGSGVSVTTQRESESFTAYRLPVASKFGRPGSTNKLSEFE